MNVEIVNERLLQQEQDVFDSFGDGLYCFEGHGSFEVSANNVAVKQGGDFSTSEEFNFWFKTRYANEECDDMDSSTND